MPPIKPLDKISSKWSRVASGSEASYVEGIENPRADWKTQTTNANAAYKQAMTQSIAADRFAKGVNRAGTAKWQQNAIEKGPGRWSQGIRLSTDAYASGFEPYRSVIQNTTLPARGPKGDPKNIDRVRVMAAALHNAKMSRTGS